MASVKERRLRELLAALEGYRRVAVATHVNPDPDAISSAWALKRIVTARTKAKAEIVYAGIIGRAENQQMVKRLHIELLHAHLVDRSVFDAWALVDTQPGSGNSPLQEGEVPRVVLDHHPRRPETERAAYYDVRENIGATATMLYEYAQAAGLRMDRALATALFYGIKSETRTLVREASQADIQAYLALNPKVDPEVVGQIDNAPLTVAYFVMLDRAIKGTRVYGPLVVSSLGDVENPDMVSECADLMLRLENIRYAFSMGRFNGNLCVSFRTSDAAVDAGELLRQVVGKDGTAGGHAEMAGGILEGQQKGALGAKRNAGRELVQRLRKKLRLKDLEGKPLLSSPDTTPSQAELRARIRAGGGDDE